MPAEAGSSISLGNLILYQARSISEPRSSLDFQHGDAKVFKKYSQMKLQMKSEALACLGRRRSVPGDQTRPDLGREDAFGLLAGAVLGQIIDALRWEKEFGCEGSLRTNSVWIVNLQRSPDPPNIRS